MASPSRDAVAALAPVIAGLDGRPAAQTELARFRQYLALLLAWNRTHRLTGCRSAEAIVRQLFLDSLLFLARIPHGRLTMVDIGTGPGIPGVPLRIVRPEIALTLIESRRKQVSFLSVLKRDLDLADVVVLEGRAEELVARQAGLAEAFDVVVMRAVGMRLLPAASRYLKRRSDISAPPPRSPTTYALPLPSRSHLRARDPRRSRRHGGCGEPPDSTASTWGASTRWPTGTWSSYIADAPGPSLAVSAANSSTPSLSG